MLSSFNRRIFHIFMVLSLLVLCIGCDSAPQTTLPPKPTMGTPTPKGFDVAGLLYISPEEDYSCAFPNASFFNLGNLILATGRLTYDSSELQAMSTYVQSLDEHYNYHVVSTVPNIPIPTSLRWESAGTTCSFDLQVTNIGEAVVQIQSIGVQLTTPPKQNNTLYRLIDACHLLTTSEQADCPPHLGGGGGPEYEFTLKQASSEIVFHPISNSSAQSSPGPNWPLIQLSPHQTDRIRFLFTSSGNPNNFIYTILPELQVNGQIFKLQQLISNLFFADDNQVTCYKLNGDTFAPFGPNDFDPLEASGPWCI